jgi:hypothetical protein
VTPEELGRGPDETLDPVGGIGHAVLADLRPPRRPRTSVHKVKHRSRATTKRPLPAKRSTPITGLAIIINDTEPNDTTHQSKGLTTALGP